MSQQSGKFVYSIEPGVCKCKHYSKIKTSITSKVYGCKFWSCTCSNATNSFIHYKIFVFLFEENDGCYYFSLAQNMLTRKET